MPSSSAEPSGLTPAAIRQADQVIDQLRAEGVEVGLEQGRLRLKSRRTPNRLARGLLDRFADQIEARLRALATEPE